MAYRPCGRQVPKSGCVNGGRFGKRKTAALQGCILCGGTPPGPDRAELSTGISTVRRRLL